MRYVPSGLLAHDKFSIGDAEFAELPKKAHAEKRAIQTFPLNDGGFDIPHRDIADLDSVDGGDGSGNNAIGRIYLVLEICGRQPDAKAFCSAAIDGH